MTMAQDYTQITFVRHGERLAHKKDEPKYPGPGLNALGKKQAQRAARFLKDARFDVIYCSDMTRAIETAEPFKRYHKQRITYHRELAEFNRIVWEKRPADEEKLAVNLRRANTAIAFFKRLLKKHKNKNLLIIGHGNATRACIGALLGYPLQNAPSVHLTNCSITTIAVRKGRVIAIPCMNLCVAGKPKPFKESGRPRYDA